MENQQEFYMKATLLERQSQELNNNLQLIENQISELNEFKDSVVGFSKSEEKEMLASLGRGVFVKTEIKDKKLLVDVGAGVILPKTPEETIKVLEEQISKFMEAKISVQSNLDSLNQEMQLLLQEIQSSK